MRKFSKSFVIILMGVLILAAVSNPSKVDFVEYYKDAHVKEPEGLLQGFFSGIAKTGVGWIADQSKRRNYVVCSVYKLGDQIYIGAFGNFIQLR